VAQMTAVGSLAVVSSLVWIVRFAPECVAKLFWTPGYALCLPAESVPLGKCHWAQQRHATGTGPPIRADSTSASKYLDAVRYVVGRDGIRLAIANAFRKRGQLRMERVESGIVHELRLHDRQMSGHGIGHRREPKFLERVLENLA
jgi:hypothetical protein